MLERHIPAVGPGIEKKRRRYWARGLIEMPRQQIAGANSLCMAEIIQKQSLRMGRHGVEGKRGRLMSASIQQKKETQLLSNTLQSRERIPFLLSAPWAQLTRRTQHPLS